LLEILHPRQVSRSVGFEGATWVRWGSFSAYGLKLPLLCATNRVPLSYELTASNVAEMRLTEELLARTGLGQEEKNLAQGLWGPGRPKRGVERSLGPVRYPAGNRTLPAGRQEAAGADSSREPQARLPKEEDVGNHPCEAGPQDRGEVSAYTYGFYADQMLWRPGGHIKDYGHEPDNTHLVGGEVE
jgi:hypothetical protein